jgi:hypothetical protein
MSAFDTTTPRTDAALALVAKARETESDYKCHDALIMSHVSLEIDYNDLCAEVKRLREALAALLQDDGAADDIGAVRKQARAALKGAAE